MDSSDKLVHSHSHHGHSSVKTSLVIEACSDREETSCEFARTFSRFEMAHCASLLDLGTHFSFPLHQKRAVDIEHRLLNTLDDNHQSIETLYTMKLRYFDCQKLENDLLSSREMVERRSCYPAIEIASVDSQKALLVVVHHCHSSCF